jgi:hypothetical protein
VKIDEYKTALRKACDDQVELMAKILREFAADLTRLEDSVKADPDADRELISLVTNVELQHYAAKLDAL